MCGICGFVNLTKTRQDATVLHNMVNTMHHRGPDSQGFFEDKNNQVFLGHSRLSIIDISDSGKQPMFFGSLTIVLNGEIYNYKEIKEELRAKGHFFKSTSDTEVALHAFQEWGNECVNRFIGMFAFAIYNSDMQTITLFRDRAGVKPLYYYFDGQSFIFGSELKVFHQNPLFHKELDFDALGLYMKFGYIPTPYCVFKNTHKLVQGSYLTFDINGSTFEVHKYWDLRTFYLKPKLHISYEDALEETERLLLSAFNYRMVSDVPVGVFLSAGYDSTCVASLLQKGMTDKLKTFTIGFEFGNNEAPMAKEIAHYIGSDHTDHYCTEEEALSIMKDLPFYYDEPFADSSAIPTTLVSSIARKYVKVALSADGGDEIFAGYDLYASFFKAYKFLGWVPSLIKSPVSFLVRSVSCSIDSNRIKTKADIVYRSLSSNKELETSLYEAFSPCIVANCFTREVTPLPTLYDTPVREMSLLSRLLYADYSQYLQDDILVKVDRASMSTSLEGRNPFLDQRIVEFVAQLPDEYKLHKGVKKHILKDIVFKYIPKDLIDKPKTGFSVPLARWLQTGLKDYLNHYLDEALIIDYKTFDINYADKIKKRFQTHPDEMSFDLWKMLQLQMWMEKWMA